MTLQETFSPSAAASARGLAAAMGAYNAELKNVLVGVLQTQAAANADPSAGSAGSGSQDTGGNRSLGLENLGSLLSGVRFPDTRSGGAGPGNEGNQFPGNPSQDIG